MVAEESKLGIILYFHVFAADLFAVTQNPTSRADETTTEGNNSDNKPERPKPPTSLITDTLKATPATQIPIVSPDRSLHARNTYIHTHAQIFTLPTYIYTFEPQASPVDCVICLCSPQTDREKDPDYDSLPSQTSQSESSMLQVICRPEATNKEEAYTFHTVHSKKVICCKRVFFADGFTVKCLFFPSFGITPGCCVAWLEFSLTYVSVIL